MAERRSKPLIRQRHTIQGIVQGVGFRPFVYRLAHELDLTGWVRNTPAGVELEIQGAATRLAAFEDALLNRLPPLALVTAHSRADIPVNHDTSFTILPSGSGAADIQIAPDSALCPDCLRELFDPADRRYRYPFITCTNCGPRYSIITGIPYDRPRLKKTLPKESFPRELWQTDWVVKIKPPIKNPEKVLDYLGRYVHRIAIANSRILSLEDGKVTFRYQELDTRRWKTMTLAAEEFLRRYLQHVLPEGFHKVRYFGLWSPANRQKLREVQQQLAAKQRKEEPAEPVAATGRICPCCGKGLMVVIEVLPRRARSPPDGMILQADGEQQ